MKLAAIHISRWVTEAYPMLAGTRIKSLHKDELRKLVTIELDSEEPLLLTYQFVPGESLLFFSQSNPRVRGRNSTTNFLPQLIDGRIISVEQVGYDRIVRVNVIRNDSEFSLIFEQFGPGSNLFLSGKDDSIITALRAGDLEEIYTPPVPPEGIIPIEIDPRAISSGASSGSIDGLVKSVRKLARGCDDSFWEIFGRRLHTPLGRSVVDATAVSVFVRDLFLDCIDGTMGIAIHGKSLLWAEPNTDIQYGRLNDAIEDISQTIGYEYASANLHQRISRGLRSAKKKVQVKLERIGKRQRDSEQAERYRVHGELLAINISSIKPGMTEVTVPNVYTENESPETISLRPDLSPSGNIEATFKKYRKLVDGIKEVARQMRLANEEDRLLQEYTNRLESIEEFSELIKLEKELTKAGVLQKKTQPRRHEREQAVERYNPRVYTTSAGETVLVGRNNKENEYVSFTAAAKQDLWFHSEVSPGSHVILKRPDKIREITRESITEAAQIAAYYSQARTSSNVSIIYTEARHLQKIKGAIPGKVRYTNVKTIVVEPHLPNSGRERNA